MSDLSVRAELEGVMNAWLDDCANEGREPCDGNWGWVHDDLSTRMAEAAFQVLLSSYEAQQYAAEQ